MYLPLDGTCGGIRLHVVGLRMEWSCLFVVLGALSGVMSCLSTAETGIVALTIFTHRAHHDILDLGGGLVSILLTIGLLCYLSWLPGMSLLHWLHFLS